MNEDIRVSIIIPCCNEFTYIAACLDSILEQDFDPSGFEVILVDGMSSDGTRDIIQSYASKHPQIRLLDNQHRTVPYALNLGIRHGSGRYIIRMDVHCSYPANYISQLLYWYEKLDADNVGAVLSTEPGNNSTEAGAIAQACSHWFGVGNSLFRTGVKEPQSVDTVPFGCYSKTLFDQIGLFDTDLTRNQDDEFNGRLLRNGGKIYLIPDIVVTYFARTNFESLWRMYYQYGLFKPMVAMKLGSPVTVRQLAPLALVTGLMGSLALIPFHAAFLLLFALLLAIYVSVNVMISCKLSAATNKGPRGRYCRALFRSFVYMHFAYGFGYLIGLFKLIGPNRKTTTKINLDVNR